MDLFQQIVTKFNTPGLDKKTSFFRLMAVAQNSQLGLRESISSILSSERTYGMQLILKGLMEELNKGLTFARAMEKFTYFFAYDEIELVRSSETMGNMPEVLTNISDELERMQKINSKIKGALTYPIVLISFAVIAVIVLLIYVIPTIVSMFPSKDSLPSITKLMINASAFLQESWYMIVLIVIGAFVGYNLLYKFVLPFKIIIDGLMLKIPVVKDTVRTFYIYRLAKLLGDFYKAGVGPTIALNQIAAIFENYFYRKKMLDIAGDLEAGFGFSESMEGSELFDPIFVQIVLVGENTGHMDEVLPKMADFYRDLLITKISTLMSLIEPLMMAVVAVIVGVIVGAVFLPMADMVNVLGQ